MYGQSAPMLCVILVNRGTIENQDGTWIDGMCVFAEYSKAIDAVTVLTFLDKCVAPSLTPTMLVVITPSLCI